MIFEINTKLFRNALDKINLCHTRYDMNSTLLDIVIVEGKIYLEFCSGIQYMQVNTGYLVDSTVNKRVTCSFQILYDVVVSIDLKKELVFSMSITDKQLKIFGTNYSVLISIVKRDFIDWLEKEEIMYKDVKTGNFLDCVQKVEGFLSLDIVQSINKFCLHPDGLFISFDREVLGIGVLDNNWHVQHKLLFDKLDITVLKGLLKDSFGVCSVNDKLFIKGEDYIFGFRCGTAYPGVEDLIQSFPIKEDYIILPKSALLDNLRLMKGLTSKDFDCLSIKIIDNIMNLNLTAIIGVVDIKIPCKGNNICFACKCTAFTKIINCCENEIRFNFYDNCMVISDSIGNKIYYLLRLNN